MKLPTETVWAVDGEWRNGYEDLDDWNLLEGEVVDEYRAPVPADALVPAAEALSLIDDWFEGHDLAWDDERAALPVVEGPELDALQVALDNYVKAHVDLRRAVWVPTGRTATWTGSEWDIKDGESEAAPDAVEEKVEQMKIEPWTKAPCATCGETFQVTRTEARDVPDAESLECPECAAYRRGVREAMGGTMNETIEKSKLRSVLSMFAMREIGPRLTLVAEVASRTGVGLNLEAARHVAAKASVETALEFCADCLPPDELLAMMKERPSEALELAPHLIPKEHLAEIALESPVFALRHVPLDWYDRETLEALVAKVLAR